MKTIGYYIRKANIAIEEAEKAEREAFITAPTSEALETAKKAYQTAKRHVKNVYKVLEIDAPTMSGLVSVSLYMGIINRKYAAFWEDIQNNK